MVIALLLVGAALVVIAVLLAVAGVVAIAVLLVIAALLAILALVLLRRPLPQTHGRIRVTGLEQPVRVVRDSFGTAHVDAATMVDAARAMGLVHAQERLWQLDFNRRVGSGRISEIAGPEAIGADAFLRRVGLRRVAEEEAATLSGETAAMLEAYAAGINAVIDSGRPLPLEFSLLRIRPQRWRPADSLVCIKLLALGLSLNWDAELQRLRLLRALGPERAARVDIVYPASNPTILADTLSDAGSGGGDAARLFAEAAQWLPTPTGASNAWAVAPERSASGRPLLCNDPHLVPSIPSVWFAAHVRVGNDFESTGVTLPGQPFPIIGHNRRIAWGYTNSMADAQDLVIEEFDGPAGARHRTEDGWRPSRVVRELIAVKGGSDVIEEVLITRHGPVVERCDDPATGRWLGLALQWTALTPGNAADTILQMQRAHDWNSFRAAHAGLDAPSQNSVYADVDGHIGYFCNGRIPVRRRSPSGLPVPGWTGDALWERFLSVDEVPQQLDPEDGLVITANNRMVGDRFAHYVAADYLAGYRARRLAELLDEYQMDPALMRAIQSDVLAPPAREVATLLSDVRCANPTADAMRQRLAAWDGRMQAAAIEPAVYEAFLLRLAEHALRPLCGNAWAIAAAIDLEHTLLGYPGNLVGRFTPVLLERWAAGDEEMLDGQTTWTEVAARALEDALVDLRRDHGSPRRWRWGRLHRLVYEHPLAVGAALRPLFNARPLRVGGGVDTIMATGQRPGSDFRTRLMAPSWRMVLEVGNWDTGCSGIHHPGQSGHRASPHHHDLRRPWRDNRQLTLGWGDQAFARGRSLVLDPTSTR